MRPHRHPPGPCAGHPAPPATPGVPALLHLVLTSLLVLAPLLAPVVAGGQERDDPRLGKVVFPNSGAPEAQEPFLTGVLLLHSFEFEDAARAFRRAQEADPDFALAYWGEAMTYNHPLWREQDRDAALEALARYQATGAEPSTERERRWLATLDELYGEGDKPQRDRRYMDAMRRLQEDFPDDAEARAFHALAILGSTDGVRDFATYMRAAATARPVFEANPRHPGAAHYIIHSFDDPVHAPLGLPAARAYADIAPDAAHAQHMTSHIFVAMGMWDDVVKANVRARDVQNARRAELGRGPNPCGHYTSWLHYGWLMQGRPGDATRGMDACMARIREGGSPGEEAYFVDMRARHVLDLEDWSAADRYMADLSGSPYAATQLDFVTAYAARKRGEPARADAVFQRMVDRAAELEEADRWPPRMEILSLELEALALLSEGDAGAAVARLEEATSLEEGLPFEFGPPASLKPPHEMLGEVLLEAGRPGEAVEAFRDALRFTPGRTLSLMGLALAAEQAGMPRVARDADARLAEIWAAAEPAFKERVGLPR